MNDYPNIKAFIDSKIVNIKRTCDLIMFSFELPNREKLFLHTQCFLRIYDANKLILSSRTMFVPSNSLDKNKREEYNWSSPGETLFDDIVDLYRDKIYSSSVKTVVNGRNKDLKFNFHNKMRIEVLVDVTVHDDLRYCENYRIFDENKNKEHIIV